jgi:hypothetical protein
MLKTLIVEKIKDYPDEKKLDLLTAIGLGEIYPFSQEEIFEATESIREDLSPGDPAGQGREIRARILRSPVVPEPEGNCSGLFDSFKKAFAEEES